MSGGIFISYRREDASHAAGRLADRLAQTFSRDQLFMDVDNIEPGLDFVKVLQDKVQACDVLLAVVGPRWLEAQEQSGTRRLDNPKDFVRVEIEAALARGIRVIPVLVDGARMPGETDLPQSLQPLSNRNAVRLAHERFGADASDLTEALAKVVVPAKSSWIGGLGGAFTRPSRQQADRQLAKDTAEIADKGAPTAPVVQASPLLGLEGLASPAAAPYAMAALGAISGYLSITGGSTLTFVPSILQSPGVYFGFMLAIGAWMWGHVRWWHAPLLLLTTEIAWRLSWYGGLITYPIDSLKGLPVFSIVIPTVSIFGWGGLGSGLSWLGVALICPQVRPIKWGLLCTIVGGIALNLVFLFNLTVESSKATDLFTQITSGFSVWQGLVAAAIGFAWLRARSDSSASTDWLTALFQKLSVRFRPA